MHFDSFSQSAIIHIKLKKHLPTDIKKMLLSKAFQI